MFSFTPKEIRSCTLAALQGLIFAGKSIEQFIKKHDICKTDLDEAARAAVQTCLEFLDLKVRDEGPGIYYSKRALDIAEKYGIPMSEIRQRAASLVLSYVEGEHSSTAELLLNLFVAPDTHTTKPHLLEPEAATHFDKMDKDSGTDAISGLIFDLSIHSKTFVGNCRTEDFPPEIRTLLDELGI